MKIRLLRPLERTWMVCICLSQHLFVHQSCFFSPGTSYLIHDKCLIHEIRILDDSTDPVPVFFFFFSSLSTDHNYTSLNGTTMNGYIHNCVCHLSSVFKSFAVFTWRDINVVITVAQNPTSGWDLPVHCIRFVYEYFWVFVHILGQDTYLLIFVYIMWVGFVHAHVKPVESLFVCLKMEITPRTTTLTSLEPITRTITLPNCQWKLLWLCGCRYVSVLGSNMFYCFHYICE